MNTGEPSTHPSTVEFSIQALRDGDRSEIARMVEHYSGPIYRLALKMLNNSQDAEDVLQETFLKALHGLKSFEGKASLSTWLYRIAVNEALMLLRQRHPEEVSIDQDIEGAEDETETMEIVDWCCLPEKELLSSEARKFLDTAINRLPEILKVVFLLRDIEGLSIRDTAETLNLSETAVKTRLLRARFHLRNQLSTYYAERLAETRQS